jgi:hypothetical protein
MAKRGPGRPRKTELLPERTIPEIWGQGEDSVTIVNVLTGYKHEAEENRKAGFNPRDQKWQENWDLYWGRYNFQSKASWQAKEVMPEVSSYVDRFAAAMKEALIANPAGFYDVTDPADTEGDLTRGIKRMSCCGRTMCRKGAWRSRRLIPGTSGWIIPTATSTASAGRKSTSATC